MRLLGYTVLSHSMPGETASRVFQFGEFEVNEAVGELRKHGIRVKLHAQPFQVLVLLLERPGNLVSRKEIQQRLWGDQTYVDFDHSLNTAVNKIREALNDSASKPRYVETVPGKGYRFIAALAPNDTQLPVEQTHPKAEAPILTSPHELPQASQRAVRTLLVLVEMAYLGFYFGALGNLQEIDEIFMDAHWLPPAVLLAVLVTSASLLIPVRLYLLAAVAFHFPHLPDKFNKLFPALLPVDLLWAVSPFLLIHHISIGLALGMSAALVYLPFAQRSLVLMYGRQH